MAGGGSNQDPPRLVDAGLDPWGKEQQRTQQGEFSWSPHVRGTAPPSETELMPVL